MTAMTTPKDWFATTADIRAADKRRGHVPWHSKTLNPLNPQSAAGDEMGTLREAIKLVSISTPQDDLWVNLTPAEETDSRAWTRVNYTVGSEVDPTWHPIVRLECYRMNLEAAWVILSKPGQGWGQGEKDWEKFNRARKA